jgi:hypothetical protein
MQPIEIQEEILLSEIRAISQWNVGRRFTFRVCNMPIEPGVAHRLMCGWKLF